MSFDIDPNLLAKFEALPDAVAGKGRLEFSPEQDEILRRFWKQKRQEDIAKLMGVSMNTLRRRYREITRDQ